MKINRILFAGLAFALSAITVLAYFDWKKVTLESKDGNRVYKKVDIRGRVRLVKQLSDKPCVLGRTWGYDRNGIWVTDGCRAEFEYERDKDDDNGGGNWIGDLIGGGGNKWDTKRVRVESDGGKRVYKRIDTSGGVKLVKRLSDKPCTLGRTWGYDRNGIWVDDGCRADFEVRVSSSGGGNNKPWIPGRVPSWAVGTWTGYRRPADGIQLTIRSDGTCYLRKDGDLTEGRRGDANSSRVRFGDSEFTLEQDGKDRLRLIPLNTGSGVLYFRK